MYYLINPLLYSPFFSPIDSLLIIFTDNSYNTNLQLFLQSLEQSKESTNKASTILLQRATKVEDFGIYHDAPTFEE